MADMKTTQERRDRFREWLHDDTRDHLSIRAWCVAEDACDDVDTLLAENARLRAAEAEVERLRGALRGMLRAHPNCHSVNCGGYGCDDDYLTDDPDGDTGGDLHVCECGAITARNAARAALGEP